MKLILDLSIPRENYEDDRPAWDGGEVAACLRRLALECDGKEVASGDKWDIICWPIEGPAINKGEAYIE